MAIIGYARVSSSSQSLDVQESKLREAGCTKIFMEKRSGKQTDDRPELARCLEFLREGDQLVACRLDRVGRSASHLMRVVELLEKKRVTLRFIDQPFQTDTATGRVLVGVLSVFSAFEFDIRRERQLDGIRKAKERGTRFGRKPLFSEEQRQRIRVLREVENFTVPALADRFGCGVASIYRALAPTARAEQNASA